MQVQVFITCMLSSYQDQIIGFLIKQGYGVKGMGKENSPAMTAANSPATLISLSIWRSDDIVCVDLTNSLIKFMKESQILFYSIVVFQNTASAYCIGNIKIDPKQKPKEPDYLSLVKGKGPFANN